MVNGWVGQNGALVQPLVAEDHITGPECVWNLYMVARSVKANVSKRKLATTLRVRVCLYIAMFLSQHCIGHFED